MQLRTSELKTITKASASERDIEIERETKAELSLSLSAAGVIFKMEAPTKESQPVSLFHSLPLPLPAANEDS